MLSVKAFVCVIGPAELCLGLPWASMARER